MQYWWLQEWNLLYIVNIILFLIIFLKKMNYSPKLARVSQREKSSTNSDIKICYGNVYLIQNCKKQNKILSHIGGPVVHRQKKPPNWAEWAVRVNCYLQYGSRFCFVFFNFESHKHFHNKFLSQNSLNFFSLWTTLANLGAQWLLPPTLRDL